MDCYDANWCPDGECNICDFWIDCEQSRARRAWARFRRFFVRVRRWDFSAGYVNLTPPSAAEALVSIAEHAEAEAGRTRYNMSPATRGSYWDGHDEAMKSIALLCRERADALGAPVSPGKDGGK